MNGVEFNEWNSNGIVIVSISGGVKPIDWYGRIVWKQWVFVLQMIVELHLDLLHTHTYIYIPPGYLT